MSDCSDLIGIPYRRGSDLITDGHIDCIHLVYEVLKRLNIPTPEFRSQWYEADRRSVLKDLYKWGYRVQDPLYDGDVIVIPEEGWNFAVAWKRGILYCNPMVERVAWRIKQNHLDRHCFRMRPNYARLSEFRRKSIEPLR